MPYVESIYITDLERYKEVAGTLTDDQIALLRGAADECKNLGAEPKTLAPLFALVYVDHRPISPERWAEIVEHAHTITSRRSE